MYEEYVCRPLPDSFRLCSRGIRAAENEFLWWYFHPLQISFFSPCKTLIWKHLLSASPWPPIVFLLYIKGQKKLYNSNDSKVIWIEIQFISEYDMKTLEYDSSMFKHNLMFVAFHFQPRLTKRMESISNPSKLSIVCIDLSNTRIT